MLKNLFVAGCVILVVLVLVVVVLPIIGQTVDSAEDAASEATEGVSTLLRVLSVDVEAEAHVEVKVETSTIVDLSEEAKLCSNMMAGGMSFEDVKASEMACTEFVDEEAMLDWID